MHHLRVLTADDAEEFRRFRLTALEESPHAFTESAAELRALPLAVTVERLRDSKEDNFVLGAFVDSHLVGTVGFFRLQGEKSNHKGRVWGVYVAPPFRRCGIARSLLDAVLNRIRDLRDIRQVSLAVATTQRGAMSLYASAGFTTYGLEPRALRVGSEYVDEEHRVLLLDAPLRSTLTPPEDPGTAAA